MPNFADKARIPVRPLSYENRDLALAKELIIDYTNGAIYIKLENGSIVNISQEGISIQDVIDYLDAHPDVIVNATFNKENGDSISIKNAFNEIYKELTTIAQSGVVLDTTLAKSGYAADAKATGDAINNIKVAIKQEADNNYSPKEHTHEISGVNGLQNALDGKAPTDHNHEISGVNGLQNSLDNKAPKDHNHEISGVNGLQNALDGKAPTDHKHKIADVENLQEALNQSGSAIHTHKIEDVDGLQTALDDKAPTDHSHEIADVNGLEDALNEKVGEDHGHEIADVNGLEDALDGKAPTDHSHEIADVNGLEDALNDKMSEEDLTNSMSDYLHRINGGEVSGDVTFIGKIILGPDNYGSTIPTEGVEGQLFFKLVEEETPAG